MNKVTIAITAASYSGNKGAAAMLQSSITQLRACYGERLHIYLMSVYPAEDRQQCPHGFVDIVPAQPQRVLFLAFPCAVLYRLCCWCLPLRRLLLKNAMLRAYLDSDLVVDEAGISFSDSRGVIMNTYAFVCMAVPLLMGVPVVKYSQAMGPFKKPWNRLLAKQILPRLSLVLARGRSTCQNLADIGISEHVLLCPDGAFSMPEDFKTEERVDVSCRQAGFHRVVGVSVSSVVQRRCKKAGVAYCRIMVEFLLRLVDEGYQVYLFANAARLHSNRPRNNDLMVGDAIYSAFQAAFTKKAGSELTDYKDISRKRSSSQSAIEENKLVSAALTDHNKRQRISGTKPGYDSGETFVNGLFWAHAELSPEELRAYIGHCDMVVASRFHAMVFALSKGVPVMLVGWSHKYREVLEQFGMEGYALDYRDLSLTGLSAAFHNLEAHQEQLKIQIRECLPMIQEQSYKNVGLIAKMLEE